MATTTPAPPTKDGAKNPDAKGAKADGAKGEAKPKSRRKLVIIALLVLVLAGGGYKMTLGKAKGGGAAPPEPGLVLKLDPITMNLAKGHFLKLTMALQFTAAASAAGGHGGGAEPDGSQALDIAIGQLSNRRIEELNTSSARNHAKEKLLKSIEDAYHHQVMDIYFTEFVMQ